MKGCTSQARAHFCSPTASNSRASGNLLIKGQSMHHHVLRTHSSLWGSGSEAEIPFSYLTAFSRCSWNLFCHFVTQCRGPCDSYTAQLHCAEKHFFPVLWSCSLPVTLDAASSSAGEAQGALIPQASPPWQSQTQTSIMYLCHCSSWRMGV